MRQTSFVPPVPAIYFDRWLDFAFDKAMDDKTGAQEALDALKTSDPKWQGFEYARLSIGLAGAGLLNGSCDFLGHYLSRYPTQAMDGPSRVNYGSLLFALGRFEKAIDHFSAILANDSSQVLSLGVRAMLYSRTGQYAKAEADLAELAKTFPRNFAQFYDLFWRRQMDAANAYFEWMESQKNLAPLFKVWGCFLLGHIDRGIDYLETGNSSPFALRVSSLYALTPSIIREVTNNPLPGAFGRTRGR